MNRACRANLVVSMKSFYRERTAMFFTIAFPIILILVFASIFMDQEKVSFHLYVRTRPHGLLGAARQGPRGQREVQDIRVEPAIDRHGYARTTS